MVPGRQISLPIMTEGKEVMVNFIVVNAFFLYTAILGRPWIHVMGVVPFTLHIKVKFPTEDGIAVVKGDQRVARQCLVAAINHKSNKKSKWNQNHYSNHRNSRGIPWLIMLKSWSKLESSHTNIDISRSEKAYC